jgi:hypothetical protein
MKPCLIIAFFSLLMVCSCNRSAKKPQNKLVVKADTLKENKAKNLAVKPFKPVFGYRFIITGDFDGDGKKDTLTEHFISRISNEEIDKFHYNVDSGWIKYALADSIRSKKPISTLVGNNSRIKTLFIDSSGESFGFAYLKNEGDLDGDGGDEISYVVDWADASSVNFCSIMTYKNHKWKDLYHFQMRDWQLPDLPEINEQYHATGMHKDIADTTNRRLERELNAFKGFVTKVANNKIRVIHFDDADLDTSIVKLKKHHIKK